MSINNEYSNNTRSVCKNVENLIKSEEFLRSIRIILIKVDDYNHKHIFPIFEKLKNSESVTEQELQTVYSFLEERNRCINKNTIFPIFEKLSHLDTITKKEADLITVFFQHKNAKKEWKKLLEFLKEKCKMDSNLKPHELEYLNNLSFLNEILFEQNGFEKIQKDVMDYIPQRVHDIININSNKAKIGRRYSNGKRIIRSHKYRKWEWI